MNENAKTPIEELAAALASMTERAMKAEQERDEANAKKLDWFKSWERVDKEHKETQAALAAEIREHQKTMAALEETQRTAQALAETLESFTRPTEPQKTPTER